MNKHPKRILWAGLIGAWCFDFLFWKKTPGVSFVIFVTITLCIGFYLGRRENIQPDRRSLWLLIPILVLACGTFIRREPLTNLLSILSTLVVMGIFTHTYVDGWWLKFGWSDYLSAFYNLFISVFTKPLQAITIGRSNSGGESKAEINSRPWWKRGIPYLRGILIAIPVVIVFASLFAAADPIFDNYLEDFVELFKLEKLPEYIFRGVYILIFGYLLTGTYLHAIARKKNEALISQEKSWLGNFLGFTETAIVLGSVDVLFLLFVVIQFRYFFGGQSNIKIDGFTYAEYARRGFSELVAVATISLLLFLVLSAVSQRKKRPHRKAFSALGTILFLLVVVILISAFMRLLLYEQVYGFTRLRTYSHVFMVWLGILLSVVVFLELFGKQKAFALASFLASIGFAFSLCLINVDGLIVHQNVKHVLSERTSGGEDKFDELLDVSYLYSLSYDATPSLIKAQQNPKLSEPEQNELAAILSCQIAEISESRKQQAWQSFHVADQRAWRLLTEHKDNFRAARVYKQNGSWWVMVNDGHHSCNSVSFDFD